MALKDRRRGGVVVKKGTGPEPATPKPWPENKPPGGKLPSKPEKSA
jgi:hypothetical protein